jgi:hypothetical protein
MNSTSKKKLVTLKFCLPRARRAVFKKIAEKNSFSLYLFIVTSSSSAAAASSSSAAFLDSFLVRLSALLY